MYNLEIKYWQVMKTSKGHGS